MELWVCGPPTWREMGVLGFRLWIPIFYRPSSRSYAFITMLLTPLCVKVQMPWPLLSVSNIIFNTARCRRDTDIRLQINSGMYRTFCISMGIPLPSKHVVSRIEPVPEIVFDFPLPTDTYFCESVLLRVENSILLFDIRLVAPESMCQLFLIWFRSYEDEARHLAIIMP